MNHLISAQNISFIKDKKKILNDVSLVIHPNDFITIIGPNGSGKSTLLRVLLNIHQATQGTVERKCNLKIGYIPQKIHIENTIPLSVYDFITLAKNVDKNKVLELMEMVLLENKLKTQVHQLSGGEFQRVMLVRALLNDPDLLVLDEPAQNLDVAGQLKFYRLLEQCYQQKQFGILMVSHDLYFVMASSTKVICLYHHICCAGEPQTISKNPEFIKIFGTDMASMMAYYNHSHDHQHNMSEE